MEVMDCKQQIQRMEERITSEESDSYKIITEILPSIAFQRNYLDDNFDFEQEKKLCAKLTEFEAIENKLKNTKTQIEQKSNSLNNLKPPTLFGKNKYEANKKKLEDEIRQLGL